MRDQVGHHVDLEWHRRIKDADELASLSGLSSIGVTILILRRDDS